MAESKVKAIEASLSGPVSFSFDAVVYQVKTTVDLGLRITLDMSEDEVDVAAMLMEIKRQGIVLEFRATASQNQNPQSK